jgi:hypothetical protein
MHAPMEEKWDPTSQIHRSKVRHLQFPGHCIAWIRE